MEQNNKHRAEDAERLPAEKLEWEAPAVDAAKLDDLGKLKALAEAATPGPWQYIYEGGGDYPVICGEHNAEDEIVCCSRFHCDQPHEVMSANAAYIAAANPAAILRIAALVAQQAARIEALEQDKLILDWLEGKAVNVRAPLRFGSRDMFWASPTDDDGESDPSDLRKQVLAIIETERKEGK